MSGTLVGLGYTYPAALFMPKGGGPKSSTLGCRGEGVGGDGEGVVAETIRREGMLV